MTNRRAVNIRGVIPRPEANEIRTVNWSPRPDSNRGPFPYQGNALPPELRGRAAAQSVLKPGDQLPRFREDLRPAADLDRRRQLGELRHQHLARVQAFGMVRAGVLAA